MLIRGLETTTCDILHETKGYDLLRALDSVPCEIPHETGSSIC